MTAVREYEAAIETFSPIFQKAFESFDGTLISGGTTAGISGLVGELKCGKSEAIKKIGYLPKSEAASKHAAYQARWTDGATYSAREPLAYWQDILNSEIDPSNVKLIGLGGGAISGFEYRLAITLGATVGIISGSGRESSKLENDKEWIGSPNLLILPNDSQTLKAFVHMGRFMKTAISPENREKAARAGHEKYRQKQLQDMMSTSKGSPSLLAWGELPESLKDSNRSQVDYMESILRAVGLRARKKAIAHIRSYKFSEYETEIMAEMEHGRWNVERLMDGWGRGEQKDVWNKTSPYIVPWDNLDEAIKEYDRDAVSAFPEILKALGYEIYNEETD